MNFPFLYEYTTTTRSCWAVVDSFGDLVPTNKSVWYWLMPEYSIYWSMQ